jgi:hypothetical protein
MVMPQTLLSVLVVLSLIYLSLSGCVAQPGDMKGMERKIKESSAEQNKRVAQQNQELEILKSQELPKLRGELEKAEHQAQEIQRESLNAQDMKNKSDRDQLRIDVNARLDDINRQMESLRKDIIDAVAKTNAALVKGLTSRLDSIDVVIGTILHRVEELEKRRPPVKN